MTFQRPSTRNILNNFRCKRQMNYSRIWENLTHRQINCPEKLNAFQLPCNNALKSGLFRNASQCLTQMNVSRKYSKFFMRKRVRFMMNEYIIIQSIFLWNISLSKQDIYDAQEHSYIDFNQDE